MILPLLLALAAQAAAAPSPQTRAIDPAPTGEPPARRLSRRLTARPRLAGTEASERSARLVGAVLAQAGFDVHYDRRVVLLSLPSELQVRLRLSKDAEPFYDVRHTFDPDAAEPADVPPYNAWSASGEARAPVLDAGRGLRADFEALRAAGVETRGKIALARYGGSYRGVKVDLAHEYGCVGVLLFSDPADDGAQRGATWPEGPWKPEWAAQRGSIISMQEVPGDPTTPGWASPEVGDDAERLTLGEAAQGLPQIPSLPIGTDAALPLVRALEAGEEPWAHVRVDAPRTLREIVNVVGHLHGREPSYVLAGNHRDAWVRGAQDAASGTVSLLRAAQRLGTRAATGWRPQHGIAFAFWDAEEQGLIGSTEWGEAHADELGRDLLAYVNADGMVGGPRFRASGTPGMLRILRASLEVVPAPPGQAQAQDSGSQQSLWTQWDARSESAPSLGLPGSGSDFAVFLHHLGLPILDLGFSGAGGGQYHTAFDDFELMDRFLDPGWRVHETAGELVCELLTRIANEGRGSFDTVEAATRMARLVRDSQADRPWLGEERTQRLAAAFEAVADAAAKADGATLTPPAFYRSLRDPSGLPDRPWFTNPWWAPGLETGYSAETLPALRSAARRGATALDEAFDAHLALVEGLERAWRDTVASPTRRDPGDSE